MFRGSATQLVTGARVHADFTESPPFRPSARGDCSGLSTSSSAPAGIGVVSLSFNLLPNLRENERTMAFGVLGDFCALPTPAPADARDTFASRLSSGWLTMLLSSLALLKDFMLLDINDPHDDFDLVLGVVCMFSVELEFATGSCTDIVDDPATLKPSIEVEGGTSVASVISLTVGAAVCTESFKLSTKPASTPQSEPVSWPEFPWFRSMTPMRMAASSPPSETSIVLSYEAELLLSLSMSGISIIPRNRSTVISSSTAAASVVGIAGPFDTSTEDCWFKSTSLCVLASGERKRFRLGIFMQNSTISESL
jgi:hypothetical protein